MIDWLRIIRFFSYAKDALNWLYEAIRGRRAPMPAEELMRYDDLYVSVMRDMLGEAHRSIGKAMRELRLSGHEDGILKLSRLSREFEGLLDDLRVWRPVSWGKKEKYSKKILDYVNLTAVCECHGIYERAEELMASLDETAIITKTSDDMIRAMSRVRTLRNTLSWALRLPSPRDFLEALRSEALKRMRSGRKDGIIIHDSVIRVAEAFVLADSKREKDAHKMIAYDVLSAIRALSPVGKPFVRLDELWDELRARVPGIGLRELKKCIKYLREEGVIPRVIEAGRRGPVAVLRPRGFVLEIDEIIKVVDSDDQLKRKAKQDGFTALELVSKTGWSHEVVREVLAEMEDCGLAWRGPTQEGIIKWFIPEVGEEGGGHGKGYSVGAGRA